MDFKKIKVDTLFTVLLGVNKGDAWLCAGVILSGAGVVVSRLLSTDLHKACPRRGREGMALVLFVHVI